MHNIFIFQSLLAEPYFDSPANETAAMLYTEDKKTYSEMIKKCVELSLEE